MATFFELTEEYRSRFGSIKARILAACTKANRPPEDIQLIWVGKNHPVESLRAAHKMGARIFGENRVQEVLAKFPLLSEEGKPLEHQLHFIGQLQSNKIRKVLPLCSAIHSVGSLDLWSALNRIAGELGIRRDVFLQVNTSQEPQKSGFPANRFLDIAKALPPSPHLNVIGLMTIGPADNAGPEASRPCFQKLHRLLQTLRQSSQQSTDFQNLHCLSMGMSLDFETAIEEGAHFIRVGTALFGTRTPLPM